MECIYYLPGGKSQPKAAFASAELSDRIDGNARASCEQGPDGKGGILTSQDGHGLQWQPKEQTWAGPFNDGKYWIGFWNDRRPTPEDLRRPNQISGSKVELLDGRKWLIPAARNAPMAMVLNNGKVEFEPLAIHRRLWGHIQTLSESLEGDAFKIDHVQIMEIVADAIATNYRISRDPREEVTLLKLISTANFQAITNALLDTEFFATMASDLEDAKKKDPT